MRSPYEVLGVDKNATAGEIKSAYHRLAKIYHPDKKGDTGKFQELNNAYDQLKDGAPSVTSKEEPPRKKQKTQSTSRTSYSPPLYTPPPPSSSSYIPRQTYTPERFNVAPPKKSERSWVDRTIDFAFDVINAGEKICHKISEAFKPDEPQPEMESKEAPQYETQNISKPMPVDIELKEKQTRALEEVKKVFLQTNQLIGIMIKTTDPTYAALLRDAIFCLKKSTPHCAQTKVYSADETEIQEPINPQASFNPSELFKAQNEIMEHYRGIPYGTSSKKDNIDDLEGNTPLLP